MEIREIELCPDCKTELCHIGIKNEDVYGCPKCDKEVPRDESEKRDEALCPFCQGWYSIDDGHCCWNMRDKSLS